MNYTTLVKAAQKAKQNSYSPYSKFKVGAALLTQSGKVYTGCNIENSSFSLTICAERTAFFKAISESHRKFKAIAIAADGDDFTPPCGACRQVMVDFSNDFDVILINKKNKIKMLKLKNLIPFAFSGKQLTKK